MAKEDAITRALAVTDCTLRSFFPSDFYRRCMYAAFGLSSLLRDAGIPTQVVGGDYICALVSMDGARMSLQGFGSSGQGEPSHFWVEAKGLLLDLGPTYLVYESSFAAPSPPIVRWPTSISLPAFMRYRERARFSDDVLIATPEIQKKCKEFIERCREMNRLSSGRFLPKSWQLRDGQSLRYAMSKKDPWALAADEFVRRSLKADFPG